MHVDDVQRSASCWLLIISTITTVIQPIKSSANLRHYLMGGGEGGMKVGGEERLFLGKAAVVANWQILKCVVLFWSLNFLLTFITATTYLPTLKGDFHFRVRGKFIPQFLSQENKIWHG